MSANLTFRPPATRRTLRHEAAYFDSCGRQLFGWVHQSDRPSPDSIGVVVCNPFGCEALYGHRTVRVFAEAIAAIDIPALRFDYAGTGDSEDIDPSAEQVAIWSDDIVSAVHELRRRTGVQRVCLLGFRLGALLAMLAADKCEAVDKLVVVAPILSGARCVREWRVRQLAAALIRRDASSSLMVAGGPQASGECTYEVSGYPVSKATVDMLSAIDLNTANAPRVSSALVIDRTDLPVAQSWSKRLEGAGIRCRYITAPGFVEMMLTHSGLATTPHTMIHFVCDWLISRDSSTNSEISPAVQMSFQHKLAAGQAAELVLPGDGPADSANITERPIIFGADPGLFGIISEPRRNEARRRAVILLNSGADSHIGHGRTHVPLARHWARHGYLVLRVDLSGIGDSGTRRGRPDDEMFPPGALDDIRAAIDWVWSGWRPCNVTLIGLSAGAYHALRAAVAGLPVDQIVLINSPQFLARQSDNLNDIGIGEVVGNPRIYRERMLSARAWRRVLTGEVNVVRIAKIYVNRASLALDSAVREYARRFGFRLRQDLGRELEEIVARGVQVIMIFAPGEPGIDLLRIQAGSSLKRLGERCRIHIIDEADHTFSQNGPRAELEEILTRELFAREEPEARAKFASRSIPRSCTKV